MLLTTLQLPVDRPHLGRIDVAASVGKPDISAHVAQVVREIAKDAEVPGFRKGKAPLKRVQEHYLKDVRARARARLVGSPPSPFGNLRAMVGKHPVCIALAGQRPSIARRFA